MKNMKRVKSLTMTAAAFAAAVCFAAPAMAQQQAGQGGRALDANPRAGSSGVNGSEGQVDYRARNNMVTGNVAGGKGLQIRQPYAAPGQFHGRLGSDDLFRFNALSLPSAPGQLNAAAPPINLGGQTSVYRSFSEAPRQQIGPHGYVPRSTAPLGGYYTVNELGPTGVTQSQLQYQAQAAGVGIGALPGRALEVTASPLLGVRQLHLQPPSLENPLAASAAQLTPGEQAQQQAQQQKQAQQENQQNQQEANPGQPGQTSPQQSGDLRQGQRFGTPYQPLLAQPSTTQPGDQSSQGRNTAKSAAGPTALIGQQLQSLRIGSGPMGQRSEVNAQATQARLNQINEQLANQAARQSRQDQTSPYAQLLNAVQSRGQTAASQTPGQPGTTSGANTAQPGQPQPGQSQPGQNTILPGPTVQSPPAALTLPTADQMDKAQQDRDKAMRQAFPEPANAGKMPGEVGTGQAAQPSGQPGAEQDETNGPLPNTALGELMKKLNYDLPPLHTLAGQRKSRTNELMKQAESKLAGGQYFDAERLYHQVLERGGDQPLARVGLVHAQLGAGLIRSAALNLRALFEEHPEVIAARYSGNLLPDAKRLRWIQDELNRAMASPQGTGEAALMMAYLGYQVGSPQLIRYGLAVAQTRRPRDPLVPVLRQIWLDQDKASSQSQSQPK